MSKKERNPVVVAMMKRSQKAGRHKNKRKENNKNLCRKKVKQED